MGIVGSSHFPMRLRTCGWRRKQVRVRKSIFCDDEHGDQVLVTPADVLSEISDAGPIHTLDPTGYYDGLEPVSGWNVTFRFTPKHKLWTEIVTCDAVVLLKAIAGE
jgi:hypothetical protein